MTIDCFDGDYAFLSNFYEAPVIWDNRTYGSSEAAYQSAKVINDADRLPFTNMTPGAAKRAGKHVMLRWDWEHVKESIMYEICLAKFTQNEDLKQKLIDTGDAELIEGNYWGDRTWGMVDGVGQNLLGKILMRIRTELSNT